VKKVQNKHFQNGGTDNSKAHKAMVANYFTQHIRLAWKFTFWPRTIKHDIEATAVQISPPPTLTLNKTNVVKWILRTKICLLQNV